MEVYEKLLAVYTFKGLTIEHPEVAHVLEPLTKLYQRFGVPVPPRWLE